MYRVPTIRALVDRSPSDAIFLQPSDELREQPFLLPEVLGYLSMPDPTLWVPPTDHKLVLGLVKIARCLGVEEMIQKLAVCLEITPDALKQMKTGALWKKIRSQIRYVSVVSVHQCYVSILLCVSCVTGVVTSTLHY